MGDSNIFKDAGKSTYENVQFSDKDDPYVYDMVSNMDPTRSLQDSNDASLENFFSRPIKIAEQEWSTSTSLGFDLDPWSLYFDNPRVSNRLNNFNLLKCNLKVKVVINGNGFQYGRMLVSYLPFDVYDNMSSNAALVRADLVQASQQPHIFLDPTSSLGGELKLPMFNFQNYIEVIESQWSNLGQLYFRTLNQLKHANGATDVVTISVFAWAEDVSMSVLTSVDQDTLVPQSGELEEANTKGTISGPATAISKYAAYLSGVPYIGPFALSTSIGAEAVGKMAKLFGYCRPPVTKNPEPFKPAFVSSLAVTNVPDGCHKLTVDAQQELTIDPRISGIGGADPLNIREIASRESYLTTFNWNIGTAPETLLWNARVDPATWAQETGPPVSYHFPACAFAALPFQHWKGTMKFRFQIVCSNFHKGRLKIVYDPNFIANNTYLTFSEYNTNYLKIVDIAEETDFTVEIGNGQERSFLNHHNPGVDSVTQMYSTTRYTSKEAGNGVIGVLVVNELTTPNSTITNDIEVNVFVSMGDDFEVAVPSSEFSRFVVAPLSPQSGVLDPQSVILDPQSGENPDSQNTVEPSAPEHVMSTIIGPGEADSPDLNKVFFGEAISSFRPLLKRYALWNTIAKIQTSPAILAGRFPNFPYYRGEVGGAVDFTSAIIPTDYNYCNTLLMHWVTVGFSGYRGSTRWKIIPRGTQSSGDRIEIQRASWVPTAPNYKNSKTNFPAFTNVVDSRRQIVLDHETDGTPKLDRPLTGTLGQAMTCGFVNNALEFETPYYSSFRFSPGKNQDHTTAMLWDGAWDYRMYVTGSGSLTTHYDIWAAAGEDFQTYFFTGMPRMYYEASPPA
jgi:hypothetical protein